MESNWRFWLDLLAAEEIALSYKQPSINKGGPLWLIIQILVGNKTFMDVRPHLPGGECPIDSSRVAQCCAVIIIYNGAGRQNYAGNLAVLVVEDLVLLTIR